MDRSNIYNVIHLSLSFILIFLSFIVAQTFQTSSNYAKHGAFAVGIIYIVFCLSNLALSSYITRLLGIRLTLIFSSLTYVLFIAANIKYNTWTLYISAVLVGFGAALLWTSQGAYVAISINKHEQVNNLVPSSTKGSINGIFFGISSLYAVIGNLIASFLFHRKYDQWIIFTVMTVIAGLGVFSLIFLRPVGIPKVTSKKFFNYFI
jgi:MFS family permease